MGKKKEMYYSHRSCKQAGVSILLSDNVNFKPKLIKSENEGHFILLREYTSTRHKNYIYYPNNGASIYFKQTILNFNKHVDQSTIIPGNFNMLLSILDRYSKEKLNETIEQKNTIDNFDLTDVEYCIHK